MKDQKGIGHIILIVIFVIVIGGLGALAFLQLSKGDDGETKLSKIAAKINPSEPPLKIKHLGIELAPYDESTNTAGDLEFTKSKFYGVGQRIFTEYGYTIEASSAGEERASPQPTFLVPAGTKVRATVDGEVASVKKIYSGDYSVGITDGKNENWVYELEHVIDPEVKVGDTVKAGQVIATASDYDAKNYEGLSLYEIGILKGGNPPKHVCPFKYLDKSVEKDIQSQLTSFFKDWEAYIGDTTLYDEDAMPIVGCSTLDEIEG